MKGTAHPLQNAVEAFRSFARLKKGNAQLTNECPPQHRTRQMKHGAFSANLAFVELPWIQHMVSKRLKLTFAFDVATSRFTLEYKTRHGIQH
jgi:hypothetical protein